MPRKLLLLAALAVFVAAVGLLPGRTEFKSRIHNEVGLFTPDQAPSPDTDAELRERGQSQRDLFAKSDVFGSFTFTDHVAASGISFIGRIVPFFASEYGHGMGVTAADFDGDSLYDLFFANQIGGNELWLNRGDGKFAPSPFTESGEWRMHASANIGVASADFDNNDTTDLLVTTVREGVRLFSNNGLGDFTDVTTTAGLGGVSGDLSGAFFFDYDNDGWLDLFITSVGGFTSEEKSPEGYYYPVPRATKHAQRAQLAQQHYLLKNNQGIFTDVSVESGLGVDNIAVWAGDASPGDLNRDGRPDILLLNMAGESLFLENVAGKRFLDRTKSYLTEISLGAMGVKFFDFNNDGLSDLFITDMHSDMLYGRFWQEEKEKSVPVQGDEREGVHGNSFFLSSVVPPFAEVSTRIGAETYWPWGVSVGDINADGYIDAVVTGGMGSPWRYGVNSVLLNDHGKRFLDAEFVLGVEPRAGGAFTAPGKTVASRSSVIFDIDNDGDLDIVTNNVYNAPPQILISNLTQKKPVNFLSVRLRGIRSNRDGLGARVTVYAGGDTYTQWHDGKSGYLAQSSLPLYFGLGDNRRADKVVVDWPSGVRQSITTNLPVNRVFEVTEPTAR
jgi:enediyne biosynthesis protein E4